MKRFDWSSLDSAGRIEALARPRQRTETRVTDTVREIMDDVQARGGQAVTDWSVKLDGAPPRRLALTPEVVADQQRIADTFYALKLIPKAIQVREAVIVPQP